MDSEVKKLLESLQEGEVSDVVDLSGDIYQTKFTLSEEQSTRKAVLCTVEGVGMGPFGETNRNERVYPVEVATEAILQNPYVKEMMKNKTLLGEPHHPKDRNEIWFDQVALSIVDMWMSEDNKYLMIKADILDTEKGRILKTLIDYGSTIGISARASGKTRKKNGKLEVMPEEYHFKTFDAVTNPGFAEARLTPVSEGVNEEFSVREVVEKLTESTDLAALKSVKQIIEYCEDSDAKELLEKVDQMIEHADKSDDEYDDSLVEELQAELSESRKREVELKRQLNEMMDKVVYLSQVSKQSSNDRSEVLEEELVNLKLALDAKQATIKALDEEQVELFKKLDESAKEIDALREENEALNESRCVAVDSLKRYRELSEELSEQLPKEVIVERVIEVDTTEKMAPVDSVVRRRKVGIEPVVPQKKEGSLNEERTGDERRVNLIKNLGGSNNG